MRNIKLFIVFISLICSPFVTALEVDREVAPRITLGGRVISTMDFINSNTNKEDGINLADSSLLTRFDKRMYIGGIAGAVIGITENEHKLQFQQLNAFYWDQHYSVSIGRTRLQNTIIEFPLLRDDDLLSYTHVGNASSNEEFDQIYGDQLSVNWFLDKKYQQLGVWIGSRNNSEEPAFANAPTSYDSNGIRYVFEQPEDLRYVKWLRHAGVLVDRQKVLIGTQEKWIYSVVAGTEFNINMDPTSNWSMGFQSIVNNGSNIPTSISSVAEQAATKSNTFVMSLRHVARPKLLTRWQAGLSVAYKEYPDFASATQFSIAPSFFYRLGQGVELLSQIVHTDFGNGLGGEDETVFQLGIAFSFDTMFNDTIGERDSILNMEHGYIQ